MEAPGNRLLLKFITKCDGLLLQSETAFLAKCDGVYYKLRQVLQSAID